MNLHHFSLKPTPLLLAIGLASGLVLSPVVYSATNQPPKLSLKSSPNSVLNSSETIPFAQLAALRQADYQWIGERIYQNECAGNPKYLTYWGEGEDFPSFGIGHFIWHPKRLKNDVKPKFTETFPAMVQFVSKTQRPPGWLAELSTQTEFIAPWSSKKTFDQARSLNELQQLRQWLLATQPQQAQFIVLMFQKRWLSETQTLTLQQQARLQHRLNKMMGFKKGLFAVVDYFNFKGIGVNQKERYQGQSWGLASVLTAMEVSQATSQGEYLEQFVIAAKKRLQLRVKLAPVERNEARWLKGWEVRLDQYL